MEKLALYGGKPLRNKPFPTSYLGASLIGDEELAELKDVIKEKSPFRHYGIGNPNKVQTFEEEVKAYFNCRFALAVSSGSAALCCAIAALGVGPNDEVILPSFGWYSDYTAITHVGALPVFVDIDENLGIDPIDLKRKITQRTKAVIVIHFQGHPCKMDEIMEITKAKGIKVIEDCAQAFGGSYKGKKLGTIGDIGIASFQQNKIITCGEGGLVITNNEEYFARAVRYHDLGFIRPVFKEQLNNKSLADDVNSFAGLQFRMSELQGAMILAQFRKLDYILNICRSYHKRIRDSFMNNPHFKIRYTEGDCGISVFLLFGNKEEAKNFENCLKAEGIPTGAKSACKNMVPEYYIRNKKLVHSLLPPFGNGFKGNVIEYVKEKCCPNTDNIIECYVAISIGPQYTEEDINDIIRAILKVEANLY